MKVELNSAANFLVHLCRLGRCQATEPQLDKFRTALLDVLVRRYRDHWFPERPFKGSGYRCLRINGKLDPVLCQAAEITGLPANMLHSAFPSELTMWIDPLEVSYRIGENGSICVLYDAKSGGGNGNANSNEPWKPSNQGNHGSTTPRGRASPPASPTSSAVTRMERRGKNNSGGSSSDSSSSSSSSSSSGMADNACKNSMRRMDYLLDPRQSAASMEQLAAYVSS